jgi:hypothetical protein
MNQESQPQAPLALTIEQLTALIKEIKKPEPPSEAEQRKLQQAQDARNQLALTQGEVAESKKRAQRICTHLRRDGTSRAVYVKHGNYLLCQKCQVIVRPEGADKKTHVNTIYDTNLFNRLFQMSATSNIID